MTARPTTDNVRASAPRADARHADAADTLRVDAEGAEGRSAEETRHRDTDGDATILDTLAAATRRRIARQKAEVPPAEMAARARAAAQAELDAHGHFAFPFEQALREPGMAFICEVKKASPSKGLIAEDFDPVAIACDYARAGAAAISCLTEPDYFQGDDRYLAAIARAVDIPVLRKDFVIDPYMIDQAKVLGASAVLLICSLLDDEQLASFIEHAHGLGLSALVEAYEPDEVPRAIDAGARIVGVNNRDLRTFEVDFGRSIRLRPTVGPDRVFVSESGVRTRADVAALEEAGVDAVLIGETLMRQPDKKAALDRLRGLVESDAAGTGSDGDADGAAGAAQTVASATAAPSGHAIPAAARSTAAPSDQAGAPTLTERQKAARAFLHTPVGPGAPCRIKLCGMSREQDVRAAAAVRPDFVGFIVDVPASHRSIDAARLTELCAVLDALADDAEAQPDAAPTQPAVAPFRVAVLVDAPVEQAAHIAQTSGIDLIQLHGHEDEAYLDALRKATGGIGVIQAFRIHTDADVDRALTSSADIILLDAGQGSGQTFDWSLTRRATQAGRPFMLAGGLSPDNVARAVATVHPWGVDMSSGIETDRLKDPAKMEAAVAAVRNARRRPPTSAAVREVDGQPPASGQPPAEAPTDSPPAEAARRWQPSCDSGATSVPPRASDQPDERPYDSHRG
jgi:indole-3-glycerol phosphate synthase/phosphoribosylanthranilate isomerase